MNSMQEKKTTSSVADNATKEESEDSVSGYDLVNEKWTVAMKSKKKRKTNSKTRRCAEESLGSDIASSNTITKHMKCDCIDGKGSGDIPIPAKDSIICDICRQAFHEKCQGLSTEAHKAI